MDFPNLHILDHDLARHKLAILRDLTTDRAVFRTVMRELTTLLCTEATRSLELRSQNAGESSAGSIMQDSSVVSLAILRSGLVMEESFVALMPFARCGHVGLYHDYGSGDLNNYMTFIPHVPITDRFFILDGVIGTSKSVQFVANLLMDSGVTPDQITIIAITAARCGLEAFYRQPQYSNVRIFTVAVEAEMDGEFPAFSLGAVPDRLYGTEDLDVTSIGE